MEQVCKWVEDLGTRQRVQSSIFSKFSCGLGS